MRRSVPFFMYFLAVVATLLKSACRGIALAAIQRGNVLVDSADLSSKRCTRLRKFGDTGRDYS